MDSKKLLTPLFLLSAVLSLAISWWISQADPGHVLLQLKTAWSPSRVAVLMSGADIRRLREAFAWDYVFIANYVFLFWASLKLIALRAGPDRVGEVLQPSWYRWLPVSVAAFDLAENRALKAVLDGGEPPWIPPLLTMTAVITLLLVLGLVIVMVRGAIRTRRPPRTWTKSADPEPQAPEASLEDVLDFERRALGKNPGQRAVGLAFSGGGIRSATFNLGVLQSLARLGLLERLDYLSTVSGGGYVGSWLHKWIDHQGTETVVGELAKEPSVLKPEPAPITHLRNYSNYLTPRLGLLSADTWTTVATYVRNLLLNLVIIVSLGAAILLLPRAAADSLEFLEEVFEQTSLARIALSQDIAIAHLWALLAFFALALTGILSIGVNLAGAVTKTASASDNLTSQGAVQLNTIAPLVASAVFGSYWLGKIGSDSDLLIWLLLTPVGYILPWLAAVVVADFVSDPDETEEIAGPEESCGQDPEFHSESMKARLRSLWIDLGARFVGWAVPVGLVGGLALWGLTHLFSPPDGNPWSLWRLITFGPPLLMTVFTMTSVLHIGLLGRHLDDHLREWLARAGAWITIYSLGWLALTWLATYGPVLLASATLWLKAALASGWLATSIWGAMAGNAQEQGMGKRWHGPALKIAPWVFIVGLAVSLSWGLDRLLSIGLEDQWQNFSTARSVQQAGETLESRGEASSTSIARDGADGSNAWSQLRNAHEGLLEAQLDTNIFWLWIAIFAVVALGLSWRLAINEFSMHQYYRNRLVRAYLGASNPDRKPNPFTGFDPDDDSLLGIDCNLEDPSTPERLRGRRPLHLICAAINLVNGSRLGWQERKAAAFMFSPFYSGFSLPADELQSEPQSFYRKTCEVSDLTLGTATAISGAAASPNMGFRSTPALTLLLTVFNVRLGWWLGNPAHPAAWRRGRPRFALVPLLAELFGLTSERSQHIYLSDGGHFENLGIYELVRRRCRFVIVTDASADPDLDFSDLGNAIRKCRTDFGVNIELNIDTLQKSDNDLSRRHCAVGKIHYPAMDSESTPELGYILYIKPTLTGDEPEDVQQYAKASDAFPHQSTADQFFDESQFESYRALGEHIGHRVFSAASSDLRGRFKSWENLITQLRERWVAPSPAVENSFSRHGETLDRLFTRLAEDDNLRFLDLEVYPEWATLASQALDTEGLPNSPDKLRSGFYLCSSFIQLMENVYLDLRLDDEYSHPDNRGWVNLFSQLAQSPMMQATFAMSAGTYGSRFQTFCRRRFSLEMGDVTVERAAAGVDYVSAVEAESKSFAKGVRERFMSPPSGSVDRAWLTFNLEVKQPTLKLPVGFGLIETWSEGDPSAPQDYLIYFQIHRHLRNTGLAQRGLAAMGSSFPGVGPIDNGRRVAGTSRRLWSEFVNFFWGAQE